MRVEMVKKGAFNVAGIDKVAINSGDCPKVWEELLSKYDERELESLGNHIAYGCCHDMTDINKINYLAGFDCKDNKKAKEMGLDILEVSENEYAVVELIGPMPESIHAGWKFVMEEYLPENSLRHSGAPDFEVYTKGDMRSDTYKMELWVPIIRD